MIADSNERERKTERPTAEKKEGLEAADLATLPPQSVSCGAAAAGEADRAAVTRPDGEG